MTHHASPVAPQRMMIGGFQVLRSPDGPYLEVAERVRAVHSTGQSLSVERGEVLSIHSWWIYRVHLFINACCYIGDAEIKLDADPTSPDGTNPITCGQTSAVGQALEFAGFGDIKAVLAMAGQQVNLSQMEEEEPPEGGETSRRMIAGIVTVMIDNTPYVPVAERVFQLYQTGTPLSMERCEIVQIAGKWVYRSIVLVGGRRYIGDAEIFFEAPAQTPDFSHPISCAQISAVGNALALAGFGDVRSILQRLGKDPQGLAFPPQLASANAVMRARQQQRSTQSGATTPSTKPSPSTAAQREQIETLCSRLGTPESVYEALSAVEADQRIADLQAEEADLLRGVDAQRHASLQPSPNPQTLSASGKVVDRAMLRHLKHRWQILDQPTDVLAEWRAFKARICQQEIADDALSAEHYEALVVALDQRQAAQSAPPATQSLGRQSQGSALVRQAPRFAAHPTHKP